LYRAVIQRETPKLAYIPYDHDEFLPTTRPTPRQIHALGIRVQRRVNRHIKVVFPERHTLYADYENYLRYELRDWAERLLFDDRTLGRDIFCPQALRSLMDRHLAGYEIHTIGKIAPIMTFEMMMRRLFDNSIILPTR
jgi:asparagine synthase (glutamine-hydrolysing)